MEAPLPSKPAIPTTRYSSYLLPFVMREEHIARLHAAFMEFGGGVAYTIDCSDGLTRRLNLEELKSFDNSPRIAIKSLLITTPASDIGGYARMRLRNSDFENIEVDVAGPEASVLKLSDCVDAVLAALTPWYRWLAMYRVWQLGSILLMGVILLVALVGGIVIFRIRAGALPPPDVSDLNHVALGGLFTVGFAAVYGITLSLLEAFRIRLFPSGTFAIGQGKRRHARLERWRWTMLLTLSTGLVFGLGAFLAKAIAVLP